MGSPPLSVPPAPGRVLATPTTSTDGVLLAAVGLERRYGRRTALAGASLELHAGERLAVLGPNGAGKSTLLATLAGALRPTGGRVDGVAARQIGWVPQRPALYGRLSARENLVLFGRLARLDDPDAEAARLLEAVGLQPQADDPAAAFSVGQTQRLNVAIGLLGEPQVVLLDEPTASLDPRQRVVLWRLLGALVAGGGAVAFSTQNVEEARDHADRLCVLSDGRVAFAGSHAALFERAGLDPAHDAFEDAFVAFLDRAGDGGP